MSERLEKEVSRILENMWVRMEELGIVSSLKWTSKFKESITELQRQVERLGFTDLAKDEKFIRVFAFEIMLNHLASEGKATHLESIVWVTSLLESVQMPFEEYSKKRQAVSGTCEDEGTTLNRPLTKSDERIFA